MTFHEGQMWPEEAHIIDVVHEVKNLQKHAVESDAINPIAMDVVHAQSPCLGSWTRGSIVIERDDTIPIPDSPWDRRHLTSNDHAIHARR